MVNNEKVRLALGHVVREFRAEAMAIGAEDKVQLASKFLKDLAKNDFDMAEFEQINHSLLKVNKEDDVSVNKFISESSKAFNKGFMVAVDGKIVAIIGDTGIGKGYSLHKLLKKYKGRVIIVQPNASVVDQMAVDYKDIMVGCSGRGKSLEALINEGHRIIVCTWDKLKVAIDKGLDFSDVLLIRDESHEIVSNDFRYEVIRPIDTYCSKSNIKFQGIVDITATATKLEKDRYDYIVRYRKRNKTAKRHILYNKKSSDAIVAILKKAKKAILVENNIDNLKFYQSQLRGRISEVVYSDIKENSKAYQSVINDRTMGECEILLVTNIINAGISIDDLDVTDIIIVDVKDTTQIAQIDSRCRKVKSIFNNYVKEARNFRRVERDIRDLTAHYNGEAERINKSTMSSYLKENCMNMGTENNYLYMDLNGVCQVDKAKIRTLVYKKYYETRNRLQLKYLLQEFSDDIVLAEVDNESKLEKERKDTIKVVRKKSKNEVESLYDVRKLLVGCCAILNNEEISEGLQAYLNRNEYTVDYLKGRYENFNINMNDNGFIQHNKEFTQLVTEENYDLDYAWNWANASKSQRIKIDNMIDAIKLRTLKETDYTQLKAIKKANPFLCRLDYLLNEMPIGIRYSNDTHLPLLLKGINKETRNETIGEKELKALMNCCFKSSRTNAKAEANEFFKGKLPKKKNKQGTYNHYIVSSYIEIKDVAKELGVDVSSITLNNKLNISI